jgi:hypothetical protein
MARHRLILEDHKGQGEHIRIWRDTDQGFYCEHLKPSGKAITVPCATLKEAMEFWRNLKGDASRELPARRYEASHA